MAYTQIPNTAWESYPAVLYYTLLTQSIYKIVYKMNLKHLNVFKKDDPRAVEGVYDIRLTPFWPILNFCWHRFLPILDLFLGSFARANAVPGPCVALR